MIIKCTGFAFIVANLTCTMPDPPAPRVVCPPLRTWSVDFQRQLADEVARAPNSAMAKVVTQTIGDRDAIRACRRTKVRRR